MKQTDDSKTRGKASKAVEGPQEGKMLTLFKKTRGTI